MFYFDSSPIRLHVEGGVYDLRAGFMTCTAASQQGAIKEPPLHF